MRRGSRPSLRSGPGRWSGGASWSPCCTDLGRVERAALVLDPVEDHDEVAQGRRAAVVHAGLQGAPGPGVVGPERRRSQQVGGAAEVELEARRRRRGSPKSPMPAARRHPGHRRGSQELRRRAEGPGAARPDPDAAPAPSSRGSARPARSSCSRDTVAPGVFICSTTRLAIRPLGGVDGPLDSSTTICVEQAGRPRSRRPPAPWARAPGRRRGRAPTSGGSTPTRGRDRAGRWLVCARGASEGDRGSDAVLRRLPAVIVAGKGGVGKTTVTAALATAAGGAGLRILVVEVEGKSGLGQMLGADDELGYEEVVLATGLGPDGTGEIRARTLTPDNALFEYLDEHGLRRLGSRLVRGGMLDVVATAAPGIDDILVLGKVKQLERGGTADLIVLDAPAAGHAITFLQSARGPARRRGRGADQHPGPRRPGDAVRPRAHAGRAGHAARGDAGQRAGRDRLRPGGRRRGQPRPGRRERRVPRAVRPRRRPGGRGRPSRGRPEARRRRRPARRGRVPARPHGRCSTSRWRAWPSACPCPSCTCRSCSPPVSARPRSATSPRSSNEGCGTSHLSATLADSTSRHESRHDGSA